MSWLNNALRIAVIAACVVGAINYVNSGPEGTAAGDRGQVQNPCDSPLEYTIGTFDDRFGISKSNFIADAEKARRVWETAINKDLFIYSPSHGMPINLVYDSRQATTDTNKVLTSEVDSAQASALAIKRQFLALKQQNADSKDQYQDLLDQFNQALAAHNAEVARVNAQGGAQKSEYDELTASQQALRVQFDQVQAKGVEVQNLTDEVNALVGKYNYLVTMSNAEADRINESAGREFDQGEYVADARGPRINVYQFDGTDKLVRLLAHEMGHALGIGHNANPVSIMYRLNATEHLTPSIEDMGALMKVCNLAPPNP